MCTTLPRGPRIYSRAQARIDGNESFRQLVSPHRVVPKGSSGLNAPWPLQRMLRLRLLLHFTTAIAEIVVQASSLLHGRAGKMPAPQ